MVFFFPASVIPPDSIPSSHPVSSIFRLLDCHAAPDCSLAAPPWVLWSPCSSHYSHVVVPVQWSADTLAFQHLLFLISRTSQPGFLCAPCLLAAPDPFGCFRPPAFVCHLPWPGSLSPFSGYTLPHRTPSSKTSTALLCCILIPPNTFCTSLIDFLSRLRLQIYVLVCLGYGRSLALLQPHTLVATRKACALNIGLKTWRKDY